MAQPLDRVAKIKMRMYMKHCFFANILFNTEFVETEVLPDGRPLFLAAVTLNKFYFNPVNASKITDEQCIGLFCHEIGHIIFKHILATSPRYEHDLANIAQDHAINLWLKSCNVTLPEKGLHDPRFEDMTWQEIYYILEAERQKGGGGGKGKTGQGQGQPGDGQVGGAGGTCDVIPAKLSQAELAKASAAIDRNVFAAATAARLAGKMPAGLEKLLSGYGKSQVPWNELLAHMMREVVKESEDWGRRNRRFASTYLPGRYSVAMGEVIIIGDTSGSMGADDMAKVAQEVEGVNELCNPERTRVIWADDADQSSQQVFERGERLVFKPIGGGGTDMRKPLKYVEQYNPLFAILMTDGYTPWPERAPPYPLFIVCTNDVATCPDYASVVRIPTSRKAAA